MTVVGSSSVYYPCVSDEHYVPPVLAHAGVGNETTCTGNALHVHWLEKKAHPRTYYMKDISRELIESLRSHAGKCHAMNSIRC